MTSIHILECPVIKNMLLDFHGKELSDEMIDIISKHKEGCEICQQDNFMTVEMINASLSAKHKDHLL